MMKKSIAFLLILVLLSGAFCLSANAVTQEKITTDLKNALNTMSDEDTVGVLAIFKVPLCFFEHLVCIT